MPESTELEDAITSLVRWPHQLFTEHQIRETLGLLPVDGFCDAERLGMLEDCLAVARMTGWCPQSVVSLGWPFEGNHPTKLN